MLQSEALNSKKAADIPNVLESNFSPLSPNESVLYFFLRPGTTRDSKRTGTTEYSTLQAILIKQLCRLGHTQQIRPTFCLTSPSTTRYGARYIWLPGLSIFSTLDVLKFGSDGRRFADDIPPGTFPAGAAAVDTGFRLGACTNVMFASPPWTPTAFPTRGDGAVTPFAAPAYAGAVFGDGPALGDGFVIAGAVAREVEIWGRAGGAVKAAAVIADGPLGEGGGPADALGAMAAGQRLVVGWGLSRGDGWVITGSCCATCKVQRLRRLAIL